MAAVHRSTRHWQKSLASLPSQRNRAAPIPTVSRSAGGRNVRDQESPARGQIIDDSPAHSGSMGQGAVKIWTAPAALQPGPLACTNAFSTRPAGGATAGSPHDAQPSDRASGTSRLGQEKWRGFRSLPHRTVEGAGDQPPRGRRSANRSPPVPVPGAAWAEGGRSEDRRRPLLLPT